MYTAVPLRGFRETKPNLLFCSRKESNEIVRIDSSKRDCEGKYHPRKSLDAKAVGRRQRKPRTARLTGKGRGDMTSLEKRQAYSRTDPTQTRESKTIQNDKILLYKKKICPWKSGFLRLRRASAKAVKPEAHSCARVYVRRSTLSACTRSLEQRHGVPVPSSTVRFSRLTVGVCFRSRKEKQVETPNRFVSQASAFQPVVGYSLRTPRPQHILFRHLRDPHHLQRKLFSIQ